MTDRELLELAAGIEVYSDGEGGLTIKTRPGAYRDWNPLYDDGDALRLATKLSLTIHQWPDEVCVCNEKGTINEDVARVRDIHAATRRAVVLAAAELGK